MESFIRNITNRHDVSTHEKNQKIATIFCKEFRDILGHVHSVIGAEGYNQLVALDGPHITIETTEEQKDQP